MSQLIRGLKEKETATLCVDKPLLFETMFFGLNKQDNINNPVHKLL